MQQTRQYTRETFKIPVRLQIQKKEISGYTHDISPGGLLIFSEAILSSGTPMALQFSFGDICYLNVSGQVVFCHQFQNKGSSLYSIGIKFAAIREWEQKILTSAVEELKQNPSTQERSLLNILISRDNLALEVADFSVRTPQTVEESPHTSLLVESVDIEKRCSPRIAKNLLVGLFPDNVTVNILNLGETGICFASETALLHDEVLLSIDLSPFKTKKPLEISAKVVWNKASDNGKFHFGARFSPLNHDEVSKIRDVIFEDYAKRASILIKDDNEDLKIKVEEFFSKDVRQYHEDLSVLMLEIDNQTTESDGLEKKLTFLTNRLLQQGDAIEKLAANNIFGKKIRLLLRELIGCWVYKSPIMKMAYEKPRGYPGDYKLFEIIYDDKPLSQGIGWYFDRYFLDNTYTQAVRSRKDKMKAILKDFITNNSSPCIRLLNIACGPCKDIRELFSYPHFSNNGKKLIFTGLDNDNESLELSRSTLNNLPANIEVRFLNENVLNLFRDRRYCDILGKQEVIYILGLSEYLHDRIFKKLIYFLFELLTDGGLLVVTYKDKNIPLPSIPPAWLCDWDFIKRTEEDLINVAQGLGSGKYSLEIERESTGCIFFLKISKVFMPHLATTKHENSLPYLDPPSFEKREGSERFSVEI